MRSVCWRLLASRMLDLPGASEQGEAQLGDLVAHDARRVGVLIMYGYTYVLRMEYVDLLIQGYGQYPSCT